MRIKTDGQVYIVVISPVLSPLSWNPDPDHQDEMIEDQHEKGKGSSTVMAARKHAMREN